MQWIVFLYELKRDLNLYLKDWATNTSIKTIADIVAFNEANAGKALRFGQDLFLAANITKGDLGERECKSVRAMDLLAVCANGRIEDLPLRYAAVATDLDSGERIALRSGDVRKAVRASIAIPGVFTPQRWGGRLLVDGALVDPVPVGPTRELGATFVIAVSVIGSEGTYLSTQRFAARPVTGLRQLDLRGCHAHGCLPPGP